MNQLRMPPPPAMAQQEMFLRMNKELQQLRNMQGQLVTFVIALLREKHDGIVFLKMDGIAECERSGWLLNCQPLPELGSVRLKAVPPGEKPEEKKEPNYKVQVNAEHSIPKVPPFVVTIVSGQFVADHGVIYKKNQRAFKRVQEKPKFSEYRVSETGEYEFSTDDCGFEVLISYSYQEGPVEQVEMPEPEMTACEGSWHKDKNRMGRLCPDCGSSIVLEEV
jgi:hypothetical protein